MPYGMQKVERIRRLKIAYNATARMQKSVAVLRERGQRVSKSASDRAALRGAVTDMSAAVADVKSALAPIAAEEHALKVAAEVGELVKSAASPQEARALVAKRIAEEQVKLILKGGK